MRYGIMMFGVFAILAGAFAAEGDALTKELLTPGVKIVKASSFGYNASDATKALQGAINSGATRVVVDNVGEWVVDRIYLTNDQELFFEKGVVMVAKRGSFKGTGDSLLNLVGVRNVVITGNGALLRMWKSDYFGLGYKKGEWRMGINIRSASNIVIRGLTIKDSGGDGIYLGCASGFPNYNYDITIRDVVCDGNARQGISVISVENLLVENCTLINTIGTAPEAGIDFEPNKPDERMVNIVVKNCIAENNRGAGYIHYFAQFNETTTNITITYENCHARNNGAGFVTSMWKGFEDIPERTKIRLVNCTDESHGTNRTYNTASVVGDILKINQAQKKDIIARTKPYIAAKSFVPFGDMTLPVKASTPQFRNSFRGLLYAQAGDSAAFSVTFNKVGKTEKPLTIGIVSPSGKKIAVEPAAIGQKKDYQFDAAETGVYTIIGSPAPGTAQLASETHRLSFDVSAPVHVFLSTAMLHFLVPAGVSDFYVKAWAQVGAEKVKVSIIDPQGVKVNEQDNIGEYAFSVAASRGDASKDEVWMVIFEKPSDGSILEDYYFSLHGVPPVMAATMGALLVPVE